MKGHDRQLRTRYGCSDKLCVEGVQRDVDWAMHVEVALHSAAVGIPQWLKYLNQL